MFVKIFRNISRLAAIIAVLVLCGGHLATLQVVAWTGMVVSYSARDGFVAGVKNTFDGEHPCSLCKAVKKGQQQEEQKPASVQSRVQKIEALALSPRPLPLVREASLISFWQGMEISVEARMERPPVPPPRIA